MKDLEEFKDIRLAEITVRKDEKHLWDLFSKHHYMDHTLPRACTFFTFYATIDKKEILIGCLGVLMQINKVPSKRITRFVILPEFQGLGYSSRILNGIAEYYLQKNYQTYIVTFHPRLGDGLSRSKNWTESTNNQKEQNISQSQADVINNSSNNLRAGEKMYRFKYFPITEHNRPKVEILIDFLGNDSSPEAEENNLLYQMRKKERIKTLYQEKHQEQQKALDNQMVQGSLKKINKRRRATPAQIKKLKEIKDRNAQN